MFLLKAQNYPLLSCRYPTFVHTEDACALLIHMHIQTHTHKQVKKTSAKSLKVLQAVTTVRTLIFF